MTTSATRLRKQRVTSPHVPEPAPGLWSNAMQVGPWLYVSGLTARGDDGQPPADLDEYEQARRIFQKMEQLVRAAGGSMNDVVKLTIFVTRIAHREKVWQARREFFSGDFPACSLVEVSALAAPSIRVEIEAVACVGCGG